MEYKVETHKEFDAWLDGLKDTVGQARIFGPGYRVYYGIIGNVLVVAGGDKGSQEADIDIAYGRWMQTKEKRHDHH